MADTQAQYPLRSRLKDAQVAWLRFTTLGASNPTVLGDRFGIVSTVVHTSTGLWTVNFTAQWQEIQMIAVEAEDTSLDTRYRLDLTVDGFSATNTVRVRSETSQVLADTTGEIVHVTVGLLR